MPKNLVAVAQMKFVPAIRPQEALASIVASLLLHGCADDSARDDQVTREDTKGKSSTLAAGENVGPETTISGKKIRPFEGSAHPAFSERFYADGTWIAFYNQRAQRRFEGNWKQNNSNMICVIVEQVNGTHPLVGHQVCRVIVEETGTFTFPSLTSPDRFLRVAITQI